MDRPLLLLGHLGLGDQLICNGLVRCLANKRPLVLVVCKRVSAVSVGFMYRKTPNIQLLVVEDDADISPAFGADPAVWTSFLRSGFDILALGLHRGPLPSGAGFADVFYDQAGVSRAARYSAFKVDRDPGLEALRCARPSERYVFVHDDVERGFRLTLDSELPVRHPGKPDGSPGSDNIFAFLGLMERAEELRLMDSCFAHMADLLDIGAGRRYLHCDVKNPADRCERLFQRPGWQFVRAGEPEPAPVEQSPPLHAQVAK